MLIEQVGPKCNDNVAVNSQRRRYRTGVEGHETGGTVTASQKSSEVGSLTLVLEGDQTTPLFGSSFMEGHM